MSREQHFLLKYFFTDSYLIPKDEPKLKFKNKYCTFETVPILNVFLSTENWVLISILLYIFYF